jgi:hypothetical protein
MGKLDESKVYFVKHIKTGKLTNLRGMAFVFRQKEWYDKYVIGIWWKRSWGLHIAGRPKTQLKYLMIGFKFINLVGWVDFKWIGKEKKRKYGN